MVYTGARMAFSFRYKDSEGHWKEKYTGERDREEAKRSKRKFEDDAANNVLPTKKAQWTVAQACTVWVTQHAAHLGSDKGRRNERNLLKQLVARLGDRKLKNITIDDVKDYQVARRQDVPRSGHKDSKRRVSARIVNLELRILTNAMKEANLWNAMAEHHKPLAEPESEIGRALTMAELQRLEAAASSKPAWIVAYNAEILAANTGLRSGEIKQLQIGDIDLERRRIRVRRGSTKSDAGARDIELNQAATEAVTRLYTRAQTLGASQPEHYLLPADLSRHTKDFDPLKNGIGFDPARHQESWRSAWRSLLKKAGLGNVRFHDLRHSFITLMAEGGVPLPVVQGIVGHMSARVTRHYTHISNDAVRKAVELLDRKRETFVGNFVGKSQDAVQKPN